jgi:hypothetical protein
MGDEVRIWTTVGSAGTLSATDLAKVTLKNAVIALGQDLAPPAASAPEDPSVVLPQTSAVVRYNITPVDGLFPTFHFFYQLELTYRGKVRARLVQVDRSSGTETDLLNFDSASFPPANSLVMNSVSTTDESSVMDFVNFAFYVEATLTAPATTVGNPAEIAVVKVVAAAAFSG